jgi:hypothetical protein
VEGVVGGVPCECHAQPGRPSPGHGPDRRDGTKPDGAPRRPTLAFDMLTLDRYTH